MDQNSVEMSQKCSILQQISLLFNGAAKDELSLIESDIAEILMDHEYLRLKHVPVTNIGDGKTYFYGEYEAT